MKRLLLGLMVMGILWGQLPSYSDVQWIETWYDEFDGLTITTYPVSLGSSTLRPRQVIQHSTGRTWYWIYYNYSSYFLFYPEWENSLIFLVDGMKISLSTDYDLISSDGAFYSITISQLKKIAYANVVKVRIKSTDTYIDEEFSEKSFKALQLFCEAVIDQKWGSIEKLKETTERIYDSTNIENLINNLDTLEIKIYSEATINAFLGTCDKYEWEDLKRRLQETIDATDYYQERGVREKDSLFVYDVLRYPAKYRYMDICAARAKCRTYGWNKELKELNQIEE